MGHHGASGSGATFSGLGFPRVEVHLAPGLEAYVTPAVHHRLGVTFLWTPGAVEEKVTFGALLVCRHRA